MSLLETLMLMALGFAIAVLIGLFVTRLVWTLGLRAGARRMQRQVPATVAELQADRDRMRAEYAMLSRKLELKFADLKARLAEGTAEVMRHRNRLEILTADLGKRTGHSSALDLEVQRLLERIAPLEGELASRTAAYEQLREQSRRKDETIAKLNAEIARRDRPAALLQSSSLPAPDRLAHRIDALTDLSKQIAQQRERFTKDRDALAALAAAPAPAPESELQAISVSGREIEEKLLAAENETETLVREMRELDQAVIRKVEEMEKVLPAASKTVTLPPGPRSERPAQRLRGIGNVVSFATRLKAAPKDIQN